MNENYPDLVCHYRDVKERIAKILFADDNEDNIFKLISMLKEHPQFADFGFVRSHREYCEIIPKGVNKGNLVAKLAELLKIDASKVIAIGDNDNDVEMLDAAHVSIVVSNATEKAKKAADYITVSNEENAIAKVIEDIENGRIVI